MKSSTIQEIVKVGKIFAEVCLAVVAYGTVKLTPALVHQGVGFAILGSLYSSIWVLQSSREHFRRSPAIVRKPFLSLIASVVCYSILQLSIDFLDYHTPRADIGILADLFILLLFGLAFSLLALSVCSLLREVGIDPFEYLKNIKAEDEKQ